MSETSSSSTTAAPAIPLLPLASLLHAIGDKTRWKILYELSAGEPLMVKELAKAIGRSEDVASKHLAVLRQAGATQIGRGRLHQIPRQFLLDSSARQVDFGYFQLRLAVEEP